MNYIVTAYSIYLPVMIGLTIWVARTIHRNTKPFLMEIFTDHETVAVAVNNLLQMGFYLIALGYGFLRMKMKYSPSWFNTYDETKEHIKETFFMTTQKELVEELASKLGGFTLFVGFLLFFNLFLMLILRRSSRNNKMREQKFNQYAQNINKPNV